MKIFGNHRILQNEAPADAGAEDAGAGGFDLNGIDGGGEEQPAEEQPPEEEQPQDEAPVDEQPPEDGEPPPEEGQDPDAQAQPAPVAAKPAAAPHPLEAAVQTLVKSQEQMAKREEERLARNEKWIQEQAARQNAAQQKAAEVEQEKRLEEQLLRMAPVPPPPDAGPDAHEQFRHEQNQYMAKVVDIRTQQALRRAAGPLLEKVQALEQRFQAAQTAQEQKHVESLIDQDLATLRSTRGLEWMAQKPEMEAEFMQYWGALQANSAQPIRGPDAMNRFLRMFTTLSPMLRQHAAQQPRRPGSPPAQRAAQPAQTGSQQRPRGVPPKGNQRSGASVQTNDWLNGIK